LHYQPVIFSMNKHTTQSGMTLIELTVVLIVLVAMAGVAVPYMTSTSNQALCDATDLSMQNLKKIIMDRYYLDTLGYFPKNTKDMTANYNLEYLLVKPDGWDAFDPETALGWRGPYVQNGAILSINPDASFQDANFVHNNISANQSQVLDAWGRPIILQIPYDTHTSSYQYDYARLVSAGPTLSKAAIDTKIQYDSSGINTSLRQSPDAGDRNNDRVLYLTMPDPSPGGNQSCGG
jgi:prepilin-type N-terminal cleavage/methylation domain-containing protein